MSKFKVGDKVRRTGGGTNMSVKVGDERTVIWVDHRGWLALEGEGYEHYYDPARYELVEEEEVDEPMTLAQFFAELEADGIDCIMPCTARALAHISLALKLEEVIDELSNSGFAGDHQLSVMCELFDELQVEIADGVLNMFREKGEA